MKTIAILITLTSLAFACGATVTRTEGGRTVRAQCYGRLVSSEPRGEPEEPSVADAAETLTRLRNRTMPLPRAPQPGRNRNDNEETNYRTYHCIDCGRVVRRPIANEAETDTVPN